MLRVGDTAPEFSVPGTAGVEIQRYQLTDFLNEGAVVLVFYPFDFSPVCTEELCEFRDAEFLTFTPEVDVFGISLDSCYSHKRFINEYDLTFPLLSDTLGTVTEEYGVAYDRWEEHTGVPKRALFTVDTDRRIRYSWKTEDAYEAPTLDELHQTVRSLIENSP